jgi:hypothetical protein
MSRVFGVRPTATSRSVPSISRSPAGVRSRIRTQSPERPLIASVAASSTTPNAVICKDRADGLGDVRVLSGREVRGSFDHGYSACEAPESLRQAYGISRSIAHRSTLSAGHGL